MPPSKPSRAKLKLGSRLSRPFYTSTLIITLLATYALFASRSTAPAPPTRQPSVLQPRAKAEECRLVHQAKDQCAFVLANCQDDEAGLLSYLTFYYCDLAHVQPVAFALLTVWLGLLFTTIGIAASDFFSVNLSTIASILGLSESLAGVTFLAFGNGSPDVFSTFAAMGSNSGSMAVGELIGAAGFITAVVAGSMALVREFKVTKRTFVRDVCFFIFAVSFSMVFLADGHLHLWECAVMVGFYVFYVFLVVTWHWYSTQRRKRRQKEAASRGHFYGPVGHSSDELEPYRDDGEDEGDDTAPLGGRGGRGSADSFAEISALERATPRIEVDTGSPHEDDEDIDRDMQVAAEVTNSMRVNRPRGSRSNTAIGQIRPSFIGALEFRSVLASLQKSGNVRLAPMHSRGNSENWRPQQSSGRLTLPGSETYAVVDPAWSTANYEGGASVGRDRARSHGQLPVLWNFPRSAPEIVTESPSSPRAEERLGNSLRPPSSRTSSTKDGNLAPPTDHTLLHPHAQQETEGLATQSAPPATPTILTLQIPSPRPQSSGHSSPSLSPFPGLSESPLAMTPNAHSPVLGPQSASLVDQTYFGLEIQEQRCKPVKWWPYSVLPPPQVMSSTLFPTLQGWSDKSVWDKFVSLISVPSIFLLVITLPVVETVPLEDESEGSVVEPPRVGDPGHMAAPISVEHYSSIEPETEWQRYQRTTRSRSGSRVSSRSNTAVAPDSGGESSTLAPASTASGNGAQDAAMSHHHQLAKPDQRSSQLLHDTDTQASEEPAGWNRWLVATQVFTGPLFTVVIVWANMSDDLEQPGKTLLRMVLYSLLGSLILLALLLSTTSAEVRPRYHFLFCFLGFIISVAWISTVAGEVVGVLKTFGVVLGISEAILGLTIFAVGNSLGDLVADITVARLGYPVMALSACFGGPMLNILLGVGIGGAWMVTKTANEKHAKHPDRPLNYKPYRIQVGGTLIISAVTVLMTLVFLLVAVPANKWVMSRKIGWSLIGIWSISTVINLVVELTGAWMDVA